MRILAVSDTHGDVAAFARFAAAAQAGAVLHAGDIARDAAALAELLPGIPVYAVAGNNDFAGKLPDELVQEFAGKRILLTHGHRYGVKRDLTRLCMRAREAEADLTVFGHTHNSLDCVVCGARLLNPGAGGGVLPGCGVIEIEAGQIRTAILRLR